MEFLSRYIVCKECGNNPATLTLSSENKSDVFICTECAKNNHPELWDELNKL